MYWRLPLGIPAALDFIAVHSFACNGLSLLVPVHPRPLKMNCNCSYSIQARHSEASNFCFRLMLLQSSTIHGHLLSKCSILKHSSLYHRTYIARCFTQPYCSRWSQSCFAIVDNNSDRVDTTDCYSTREEDRFLSGKTNNTSTGWRQRFKRRRLSTWVKHRVVNRISTHRQIYQHVYIHSKAQKNARSHTLNLEFVEK